MKKLLLLLLAVSGFTTANAVEPALNWAKLVDTKSTQDIVCGMAAASDGNALSLSLFGTSAATDTVGFDGVLIGTGAATVSNSDVKNLLLIKHKADGSKQWAVYSKHGDYDSGACNVLGTADGGALVMIKSRGNDAATIEAPQLIDATGNEIDFPDFPTARRVYNTMLFKVNDEGNVQWVRHFAMDQLPVPNATATGATDATTNAVTPYGLTVDADGNIYIGGNFRSSMIFTGQGNSTFVLTPRNIDSYSGDVQTAAGGLFLVKLDADGNYLSHLKVSGATVRDQIAALAYADGNIYFCGNAQGAQGDKLTVGDKTVTIPNALDGILYGSVTTSLAVNYVDYITAYGSTDNGHTTQIKNLRAIDGNVYILGLVKGGFGPSSSTSATISSAGKPLEGFAIKLAATDGSWSSAEVNGLSIGGYFDALRYDGKTYLFGYRINVATGVFLEEYADDSSWTLTTRHLLVTQGGVPLTSAAAALNASNGNLVISARGNKAFTLLGGQQTTAPSGYGGLIASFNLAGQSSSASAPQVDATVISANRDGVIVNAAEATRVDIFNALGQAVVSTAVKAGVSTFSLPAGIYVANGQKVIVG